MIGGSCALGRIGTLALALSRKRERGPKGRGTRSRDRRDRRATAPGTGQGMIARLLLPPSLALASDPARQARGERGAVAVRLEHTSMRPPCARNTCWLMNRPRPRPCDLSRRRTPPAIGSNRRGSSDGGTAPRFQTWMTTLVARLVPSMLHGHAVFHHAMLNRVRDQVREHLRQAIAIPHALGLAPVLEAQLPARVGVVQFVDHLAHQRHQIEAVGRKRQARLPRRTRVKSSS